MKYKLNENLGKNVRVENGVVIIEDQEQTIEISNLGMRLGLLVSAFIGRSFRVKGDLCLSAEALKILRSHNLILLK